jgi:hypothetical protein
MRAVMQIFVQAIPVLIMIGLITIVRSDYLLSGLYFGIILLAFALKYERRDILILFLGAALMTISEYLFISTGVETFARHSFLGVMPLWLPILWGYGFVVIKRSVSILNLV